MFDYIDLIKIPDLKKSSRTREYTLYDDKDRDTIIYKYLFEGVSHRVLDEEVLKFDSNYSRGWQSMGILHYLGIQKDFKGIFKGIGISDVIDKLENKDKDKFFEIINALKRYRDYNLEMYVYEEKTISNEVYVKEYENNINISKKTSDFNRLERLKKASKKPRKINIISPNYERNPDVIVEVLNRANGFCERCKNQAPFIRKSDNTSYLEVHHIIPLSKDGEDTVENAVALCPNCHRELHFGI